MMRVFKFMAFEAWLQEIEEATSVHARLRSLNIKKAALWKDIKYLEFKIIEEINISSATIGTITDLCLLFNLSSLTKSTKLVQLSYFKHTQLCLDCPILPMITWIHTYTYIHSYM